MNIQTREGRLKLNTISSLMLQITTVVCGFILPRLILKQYGSDVNGLVNSITQFLGLISFLELGVGAVVQSSLYKPLAENDDVLTSKIVKSAQKFFRKLADILLVYIIVLIIIYPFIANQNYGWLYTGLLIAAMSISSFAQYYFGVVNRLLLTADQRGFVQYTSSIVTLIANTIACAILIKFGASIHIVKLTTSLIFLLRPLYLEYYVRKNYSIDRKIKYDKEPIEQKWNGVAQHVAAVVLDGTDSVVLTIFATLADVSIYSVFFLVVNGIKTLLLSLTGGIQSVIGELWARQDLAELKKYFSWSEWAIHTGTTFVFTCTGVLVLPFVMVYTRGITDANYYQPLFAILITLANAGHCLRLPYNVMILAGGHYKQTQSNYIVAAVINIVVSVVLVNVCGLIGVAIGTLIAMFYQTAWMAIYDSKYLIKWPLKNFFKQVLVDAISVGLIIMATSFLSMTSVSYVSWFILAVEVALIAVAIICIVNLIFYRDKVVAIFNKLLRK